MNSYTCADWFYINLNKWNQKLKNYRMFKIEFKNLNAMFMIFKYSLSGTMIIWLLLFILTMNWFLT